MIDANKYIDRLRLIIKSTDEMKINKGYKPRLEFITNRVKDIIKDYDEDFDKTLDILDREVYYGRKGERE